MSYEDDQDDIIEGARECDALRAEVERLNVLLMNTRGERADLRAEVARLKRIETLARSWHRQFQRYMEGCVDDDELTTLIDARDDAAEALSNALEEKP